VTNSTLGYEIAKNALEHRDDQEKLREQIKSQKEPYKAERHEVSSSQNTLEITIANPVSHDFQVPKEYNCEKSNYLQS